MFGRYDDDWNDEENLRTYLFTDREYGNNKRRCLRMEVECTPSEARSYATEFFLEHDLKSMYIFELVEMAQWIPAPEEEVLELAFLEDVG